MTNNYPNEDIRKLNNSITNKQKELSNIKKIYNNIKKKIYEFEKECEYKITFKKKNIQKFFDKINVNETFNYKKYINDNKIFISAKLFILCQNEEDEKKKNNSPFINDLKQFLKLEICPLMKNKKDVSEIIKNTKINSSYPYFIYSNDIMFLYDLIVNKPNNLFFIIKNGDKEYFADEERLKNFLDYESIIKNKINKFFNEYKSNYSENAKLMKDNLSKKLIHDLKQVFPLDKSLDDLNKSIENLEFDIDEDKKKELINYFEIVFNILNIQKKDNENYLLVENIFENNLNELIQNILSRHLYDLFFYKIQNIIVNGVDGSLVETLQKYK